MNVKFYATLRQIVGQKMIEVSVNESVTVRQLIDQLTQNYPGLRQELIDPEGEIYGHVHVLVNGRDFHYLEQGVDTLLSPDDIISVFPAVGGG